MPAPAPPYHLPGGRIAVSTRAERRRVLGACAVWLGAAPALVRVVRRLAGRRAAAALLPPIARGMRRALRLRLTIDGLAHVDPRARYVVMPIHEGFADAVALLHLPLRLRFVARDELAGWRTLGALLHDTGQILVCPERPVASYRRMLRGARAAVAEGESVVVFPQGSLLGIETRFHGGPFRLAHALGLPILPVALTGTHRVWEQPFSPRLRRGERVTMRILPPIEAATVASTDPGALRVALQRTLKTAALAPGMAPARRYAPGRDGWWDGYAFAIDPAWPELRAAVARRRREAGRDPELGVRPRARRRARSAAPRPSAPRAAGSTPAGSR